MNREDALTYLNLIDTAPQEAIQEAIDEQAFELRNYFFTHYPLRQLFQKRANQADKLVDAAETLNISIQKSAVAAEIREVKSLGDFEMLSVQVKNTMMQCEIGQMGDTAMRMVELQELFEAYVITLLQGKVNETQEEVKIGFPVDFMQFRSAFSKYEKGEELNSEQIEVLAKEVKRIQARIRLQTAR